MERRKLVIIVELIETQDFLLKQIYILFIPRILKNKNLHVNLIEFNGICVRALRGPVHLGIRTGPLCPMFYY